MLTFDSEVGMGAVKATHLKMEDLPSRVQAAILRRETVAISGAPFPSPKRHLGALAGRCT
jgi:hypothetical protein